MKLAVAAISSFALLPLASVNAGTFYTSKLSFDAAVSTTLVEDFENTGAPVETVLASFSHNGITFTGLAGVPYPNVYILGTGEFSLGAGVPQPTTSQILTANGDENIRLSFDTAHNAVGLDVYLNGLGAAELRYYNGVTLLDSYSFPGDENDRTYLGYTNATPITSVQFVSSIGASINTAIDNISVDVPEPASLLLLSVGMLGLSLCRRRNVP